MQIQVIRTDGQEETYETTRRAAFKDAERLISAACLDTVNLRDGRVMLVDDHGYETEAVEHGPGHVELRPTQALKAVNAKATALYLGVCRPGTTHQIVGDVAIVLDADFGDD